jgi:hypothetical protein
MICGSLAFAKEMLAVKKKLEKMGHTVNVPHDTDIHIADEALVIAQYHSLIKIQLPPFKSSS